MYVSFDSMIHAAVTTELQPVWYPTVRGEVINGKKKTMMILTSQGGKTRRRTCNHSVYQKNRHTSEYLDHIFYVKKGSILPQKKTGINYKNRGTCWCYGHWPKRKSGRCMKPEGCSFLPNLQASTSQQCKLFNRANGAAASKLSMGDSCQKKIEHQPAKLTGWDRRNADFQVKMIDRILLSVVAAGWPTPDQLVPQTLHLPWWLIMCRVVVLEATVLAELPAVRIPDRHSRIELLDP